ncbi:MAG: hypothetical protein JXL20_10050 [Deltaproteobacteria bacterium]|nr:hypothetical protein [Deltaproteobacteria bacterium]
MCCGKDTEHAEVRRRRYIQWSLLRHYEVCPIPLLDLTHGPPVACAFAFLSQGHEDPLVFVFAVPYVTNRVTINSEYDLIMMRLLGKCPPQALRPYFQEGYGRHGR